MQVLLGITFVIGVPVPLEPSVPVQVNKVPARLEDKLIVAAVAVGKVGPEQTL